MEGVRYTNNNRVCHKSIDASNSGTPKQQQGILVMPLTSWCKQQQGSHNRDASKSSLASNSRDTSNSSEVCKIGDLSNDRKASNSMALVISNAGMTVRARKLATRWKPARAGTPATAGKPWQWQKTSGTTGTVTSS